MVDVRSPKTENSRRVSATNRVAGHSFRRSERARSSVGSAWLPPSGSYVCENRLLWFSRRASLTWSSIVGFFSKTRIVGDGRSFFRTVAIGIVFGFSSDLSSLLCPDPPFSCPDRRGLERGPGYLEESR